MLLSLVESCVTPRIQTVWKAETPLPYRYNKILVVAIVPAGNDSLQSAVERQTVQKLQSYGYDAVSYLDGFSIYEIGQLTQEAAYFTLCNKGIDCILTLAKCDPASTVPLKKGAVVKYPASFYYDHIWDYHNLANDKTSEKRNNMVWESILFDLNSLEQQSVIQVDRINSLNKANETGWVSKNVIARMLKEKIIDSTNKKNQLKLKSF